MHCLHCVFAVFARKIVTLEKSEESETKGRIRKDLKDREDIKEHQGSGFYHGECQGPGFVETL